jgi:hypothetical protein
MTVAGNPSILLPVQDGPVATCCHLDVCFVYVNCTVDFAAFISVLNYGTSILCVGFYVELPQRTQFMVNGARANYNLTTWLGASTAMAMVMVTTTAMVIATAMVRVMTTVTTMGSVALIIMKAIFRIYLNSHIAFRQC